MRDIASAIVPASPAVTIVGAVAAERVGQMQVPTITIDGLTDDQKRAYVIADMRAKPSTSHTLDRIDPKVRWYGPGLCSWADKKEQTRNRSNTVFLTDRDGVCCSLAEWAERAGQTYDALRKRHQRHRHEWTDHEIIYGGSAKPKPTTVDLLALTPWPGSREQQVA